ncbi:nucleotide exchange factor GrpE [Phytoactinopolyspora halotolerans]|uniref:Protein GrpE n=1 Tax=Phytoactinopolyspora halotolerans TaxID=1981512 RepID=A0A6L9S531_9ACTN|nr:nucleotide exchange factor GrpE [Phytoactinopolyspora halotolerans]NED99159.1 nucleotide exchange factor GrpE [Phytoactinopolyspora halotolerans]
MTDEQHEPEGSVETPVVRDRRRIDPETGELREPDAEPVPVAESDAPAAEGLASEGTGSDGADDALAQARAEAAERLDDLRRLQAEYVNYRRRVERDRETVREAAKAEVLTGLLDVLDDIGRAREHGDLTGAFRAVGEALEAAVNKAGLEQYGEPGDEFDPTIHEALMHSYDDTVDVVTCTQILQPGYRVGDRILRAARVAVAEPTEALTDQQSADAASDDEVDSAEPDN